MYEKIWLGNVFLSNDTILYPWILPSIHDLLWFEHLTYYVSLLFPLPLIAAFHSWHCINHYELLSHTPEKHLQFQDPIFLSGKSLCPMISCYQIPLSNFSNIKWVFCSLKTLAFLLMYLLILLETSILLN